MEDVILNTIFDIRSHYPVGRQEILDLASGGVAAHEGVLLTAFGSMPSCLLVKKI